MLNSRGRIFFFLVAVFCVVLLTGIVLRGMITGDIRRVLDNERGAPVRIVASDLEWSYEQSQGWKRADVAEATVRALMLGMRVEVKDARGGLVMDTEQALALLPPGSKARVLAAAAFSGSEETAGEQLYPLVAGGGQIGGLAVKFLKSGAEDRFVKRWGGMVMAWAVLTACLAVAPGLLLSRKPAVPAGKREQAKSSRGSTDLNRGTTDREKDGTAQLSEEQQPTEDILLQGGPALTLSADTAEDEPEEPADEEDVQPQAGGEDRIKKIIEGLDELDSAQALGRALRKQPLELAQRLNGIMEDIRSRAEGREIAFKLECEEGLVLSADPVCLAGIMTNLLDNSIKAVTNTGTITVTASAEGDHVRLAVRDTGRGIKRKDIPHIFERFYRGSGNGIGIGLTIVKELVDVCKGTIEVRTARGQGCLVTVLIPR